MKHLISILLSVSTTACALPPSEYVGAPIQGRVVDSKTREPLADVLVLAQWQLQGGLEGHSIGVLHVEETKSDAAGAFRIAGWGPVARPADGRLGDSDPQLLVFKSDFLPVTLSNYGHSSPGTRINLSLRESFWDGKTIALQRFDGSVNEYGKRILPVLAGATHFLYLGDTCLWKRVPRTVRAFDIEMVRDGKAGVPLTGTLSLSHLMIKSACGPFDDFLKAYDEAR